MDRNPINVMSVSAVQESLSARRAWIEIANNAIISVTSMSLSARRAWIEIMGGHEEPFGG